MEDHFSLPPKDIWIDYTSEVSASIDRVYGLLSDISGWPSWAPGLIATRKYKRGLATPGSFFLMTLKVPVIGRIYLPNFVYHNRREHIEWGGGFLGSVIRHSFELEAVSDNVTRVRHLEYSTGLLCLIAKPMANFAHRHDMRWSGKIEEIFGVAANTPDHMVQPTSLPGRS